MFKYICILSLFLINFVNSIYAQNSKTEIVVLSTLHKIHQTNPNYPYDSILSIIDRYNPDVIGFEIRPEDLHKSKDYLEKFYPLEMREYLFKRAQTKYYGFDWLGDAVAQKDLSEEYFLKQLEVRQLQQKLSSDEEYKSKLKILEYCSKEKNKIALNASPQQMIDGRYDVANRIYYKQLADLLMGSPYQGISDFFEKRDLHIAQNIQKIIEENPSKKILIFMGADHRSYTLDYLDNLLNKNFEWGYIY